MGPNQPPTMVSVPSFMAGPTGVASTSRSIAVLPAAKKETGTSRHGATSSRPDIGDDGKSESKDGRIESSAPAGSRKEIDCGATLYFRDGTRRIDFVLAFNVPEDPADSLAKKRARDRIKFERRLRRAGIDLEHEEASVSHDGQTGFVKLHGTWDFLQTQASALGIRIPLKVADVDVEAEAKQQGLFQRLLRLNPLKLSSGPSLSEQHHFTAAFDRRYVHHFDVKSRDTFFTGAQRGLMVWDCLLKTASSGRVTGIKQLIKNSTYAAAYPLHEELNRERKRDQSHSDRQILYDGWANPRMYYKSQPLSLIRKYFGEKISLYFAWLGYYTKALVPAALVGVICMIYGGASFFADIPSEEVCDTSPEGMGNTVMCPNGRMSLTHVWNLSDTCLLSKVTHVFDNAATVVFALFMSVWAMMFLEGWKHRQAELAWDWGMHEADIEEESQRPEYQIRMKTQDAKASNSVRNEESTRRLFRILGSMIAVVFFLCLVLAFLFGIIAYRLTMRTLLEKAGVQGMHAVALSSLTAALANLVVIMALDYAYQALAWYLTTWEYPRTERQFEDSYALKVFLFQFINHYSSLVYVAFFKGRFSSVVDMGKRSFETYAEMCDPAGCMVELLILLSVIMVGKQFSDSCMEIVLPLLRNKWREWRRRRRPQKQATISCNWEKDYQLNKEPALTMFNEYLEMAVQYGFITLFVAAFPLAPFFALVNNLMEIRLDAFKILVAFRRPVAVRARDLGVWYRILDGIGHLAVLTNACVIAFTSDFVPRMLYKFFWSKDGTLAGYVESTLSWLDTRTGCASKMNLTEWSVCKLPYCRFHDYRNPPCSLMNANITFAYCETAPDKYGHSMTWWHVMLARFLFVFAFENLVLLFKGLVSFLVPDLPAGVIARMQRERNFEEHLLYKRECVVAEVSDREPEEEVLVKICPIVPKPRNPDNRTSGKQRFEVKYDHVLRSF